MTEETFLPLLNAQYDAIMRSYANRQAENRSKREVRLAKIHQQIPELASLEATLTSLHADKVRASIDGNQKALQQLKGQLESLSHTRKLLLEKHGYTLRDLELSYTCQDCRDTGYIGTEKCHCFRQAEIDLLYHQSHLKDVLERENFNTFSYIWYENEDREIMKRHVIGAELFIESFDKEFQNLLLLGKVGTGKTFLSNCIAKALMDTGHSVVYLTAFQLFQLLSKTVFGESSDKAEAVRDTYPYIFNCDLLIIDDLGTELPNSFTVSQFFLCMNERILRRKSTLISSNLDMEALESTYSDRILSRILSSYTIWQLPGSDIRIRKKLYSKTSD